MKKNIYLIDGSDISSTDKDSFQIPNDVIQSNGNKLKINFVGLIINKEYNILSLPKHYINADKLDQIENNLTSKLILSVLQKFETSSSFSNHKDDFYQNIPLKALEYIVSYYNKYGIFKNDIKKESTNPNGRIHWKKTFAKGNKIISNGNIIFYPFISTKIDTEYDYLSRAMENAIDIISKELSFIFNINKKNSIKFNQKEFKNEEIVIMNLTKIKSKFFKDIHISLIENLISFYKFFANANHSYKIYNKNFDLIWQDLVTDYLNKSFIEYKNKAFIFETNKKISDPIRFNEFHQTIDDQCEREQKSIIIDHFAHDGDLIYLFDSKYYNTMSELNYKQVVYHYFIMDLYNHDPMKIINALVLPTSENYIHTKCHIDRIKRDGLYIHELYLPLKSIMENYIQ